MRALLFFFTCLASLSVCAQIDSVYFEFPLFFEDAIGNKDTVYIGLSEFANSEFNPHLGEVNLVHTPFDSVFEVRLAIFDELAGGDLPTYLGKSRYAGIQLTMDDPRDCTRIRILDGMSFVVHSLHPPLKISWNSEVFREGGELNCIGGTWLNNTHAPLVFFGWEELHETEDAYKFACLMDPIEEVTIMPYNLVPFDDGTTRDYDSNFFQDFTLVSVEGSEFALDTLVIYNLWWRYPWDPLCSDLVSTHNMFEENAHLQVFPNPTSGILTIRSTFSVELKTIKVFSTTGSLIRTFSGESGTIDTSDLSSGLYLLEAVFNDGRSGMTKFIKH